MKFFDIFRKPQEEPPSSIPIPFSTIIRWSLYDLSVENPNEVAVAMGLSPVSEEGHQKEYEDSDSRLENTYDLLPFVDILSDITSKICTAVQLRDLEKHVDIEELELTPEAVTSLVEAQKAVAFSAIIAALSSGIELGILHANTDHIQSWKQESNDK